jgi:hypothetical protein
VRLVEKSREVVRAAKRIAGFRNENLGLDVGPPPPPRTIGIIELAKNREKILELQWVTGKILSIKDLPPLLCSFSIELWVLSGSGYG